MTPTMRLRAVLGTAPDCGPALAPHTEFGAAYTPNPSTRAAGRLRSI